MQSSVRSSNWKQQRYPNTVQQHHAGFHTSMCPTDVGEDITKWLLNIGKPHHIKVKEFVTRIKEINHILPFLLPPFNTSSKQEELFAIIKKSIPSFEGLFRTNNARNTVTTQNQL